MCGKEFITVLTRMLCQSQGHRYRSNGAASDLSGRVAEESKVVKMSRQLLREKPSSRFTTFQNKYVRILIDFPGVGQVHTSAGGEYRQRTWPHFNKNKTK